MIKQKEKALLIEFMEGKTAEDRLQDRLRWQHAVSTAIKKQMFYQKKIIQRTPLN